MTTGDVVYSLRFSLIKILPEPGFDLGSTAGESCVLTARLHMLYSSGIALVIKILTYASMPLVAKQTSVLCHHANSMFSYLDMLFLSLRVCTHSSFALLK